MIKITETTCGARYIVSERGDRTLLTQRLRREDGVMVVNFNSIMIIDYDLPSERHLVNTSEQGASYEKLLLGLAELDNMWGEYGLPSGPATWRIHRTAGGFHAFRLDAPVSAKNGKAHELLFASLCDKRYAGLVRNTKLWPVRTSKKRPEESEVFVVIEDAVSFSGDVVINAECADQLRAYEILAGGEDCGATVC